MYDNEYGDWATGSVTDPSRLRRDHAQASDEGPSVDAPPPDTLDIYPEPDLMPSGKERPVR